MHRAVLSDEFHNGEARELNTADYIQIIRENGQMGAASVLLSSYLRSIASKLNVSIGGEARPVFSCCYYCCCCCAVITCMLGLYESGTVQFRAARVAAEKVGARVFCGDRDMNVTLGMYCVCVCACVCVSVVCVCVCV